MNAKQLETPKSKVPWLWIAAMVVAGGIGYAVALVYTPSPVRLAKTAVTGVSGKCEKKLTRAQLEESLALGTGFLLRNQLEPGNFEYEYDWVKKKSNVDDNQVRQAGAMWGLALIYHNKADPQVLAALKKALAFFEQHSKVTEDGRRYIVYPTDKHGSTGTIALCALSITDMLRARPPLSDEETTKYKKMLDEYLKMLLSVQQPDGLFHQSYKYEDGSGYARPSSYFDGESLLALIKAAKYAGRQDLKPIILKAADAGYLNNVKRALKKHKDSAVTKGYYQWSSMAFYEIFTSGWEGVDKHGKWVLRLADWMIDVHRTLIRQKNTGYAYEGIVHAYETARLRKDKKRQDKIGCVIDQGLERLISMQVGSSLANPYIKAQGKPDDKGLGGVQNMANEAPLRIDVAQHQMHATILALRYAYK